MIFPNSKLLAMIIDAIKLPENSSPIPFTEKKAPHPANNKADKPNKYLNIFLIF